MALENDPMDDTLLHSEEPAPWYCVRAQPRRERIAWNHLRSIEGLDVIFPRARYLRKSPQGKRWVLEALFPGYLFVQCPQHISTRALKYAMGVSYLVRRGQQLATLPQEAIDEILSLCQDGILEITSAPLCVGDRIKVIGGIFLGTEAEIVGLAPAKERVRILLELLGRETVVDISADMIDRPKTHPLHSR